MKKLVLLAMIVFCVAGCDNAGRVESTAESLGQKIDTALEKIGDSAKAKGKRTLDVLKTKVNDIRSRKDTVETDSTEQKNN